jgi:DNA repair exonuclease SbcCD nuclease subunit
MQAQAFVFVLLPGNQDARTTLDGHFYGKNTRVLSEQTPYIDVAGVRFHGVPFQRIVGAKVFETIYAVRKRLRPDATNILLYHGELLDLATSDRYFGDEEHAGYLAARVSFFDDLGLDYVLAGHLHSNFEVQQYRGGFFVYPGSPVSISERELGIRKVNLFDVGDTPTARELETLHYERLTVQLNPFSLTRPTEMIQAALASVHRLARVHLTIEGFVHLGMLQMTEGQLVSDINDALTSQVENVDMRWQDISFVWDQELLIRFLRELENTPHTESKKTEMRELGLRAIAEACGAN